MLGLLENVVAEPLGEIHGPLVDVVVDDGTRDGPLPSWGHRPIQN